MLVSISTKYYTHVLWRQISVNFEIGRNFLNSFNTTAVLNIKRVICLERLINSLNQSKQTKGSKKLPDFNITNFSNTINSILKTIVYF